MAMFFDRTEWHPYPARMIRVFTFLLAFAIGGSASAQDVFAGGNAIMSVTGARTINIADAEALCGSSTPVAITVRADPDPAALYFLPSTDVDAFAWWTGEEDDCTGNTPDPANASHISGPETYDILGANVLILPDDFSDVSGFTEDDLVTELAGGMELLCPSPNVVGEFISRTRRLCLAINYNSAVDDNIDAALTTGASADLYGWVAFEIDTVAPPVPDVPTVTSLDSGLQVATDITSTDGEDGDILEFEVIYKERGDVDSADCSNFEAEGQKGAMGDTSTVVVEDLDNDTEYELCIRAHDDAGNVGPWSPIVIGTPVNECSFLECFPGDAPSGFCGAMGSELFIAPFIGLLIGRRRRRKEVS